MKLLLISEAGYGIDPLFRASNRGHQVRVWIKEPSWKNIGDGLLPKVDDWKESEKWCDFVVFDHSGMSEIRKQIKKPCFGGGEWSDKLEKDRTFAHSIFNSLGFDKIESVKVKTIEEAQKHVVEHKKSHVVKPVGKNVDSHHVIIGEYEDGSDVNAILESYKAQGLKPEYLEIEERKLGIEVGLSGWFIADGKGGGEWSGDIEINFEHKRYATGFPEGIGPLTGETGTAQIYVPQTNRFFKDTLDKLKPILRKESYRGQIDVSFIVEPKTGKYFPLEATPRLGYPAIYLNEALQITPIEELFYNTAIGNYKFQNKTKKEWCIGVVVMTPGFPSKEEAKKRSDGVPIFKDKKIITLKDLPINPLHLVEVRTSKEGIVTSPGMGYPVVVTGTGKTLDDAKRSCYMNISLTNPNRIYIPNSYWRTDIGDRVMRQMPDIKRLGIIGPDPEVVKEILILVS